MKLSRLSSLAGAALVLTASLALAQSSSSPGTASWTWTAPTDYTDGTPISATDAAKITYSLYLGTKGPQSEPSTPTVSGLTSTAYTSSGYTAGEVVCGRVSAVLNGEQSAESNEACKTFAAIPKAPALAVR